jgi:hypothetical protein
MKKVTLALAAGVVLFASCKKDYQCSCTGGGFTITQDYAGLTKDEAATQETNCTNVGCTWSVK